MRTTLRSRLSLLFMSFALLIAVPAMAFADDIYNNLDPTIDSNVETTNLTAGGANGTVNLHVDPTNGDDKNGCNLTSNSKLVAAVNNTDASVATVSPSSVEFTSCGDVKQLTVSPLKAGETTISLRMTTNTTAGSFNLAPATFKVVVAPAAATQKDTSLNVSSASGTYGGTTDLSATLSSSSTGVSGKSVAFTLAGETVGSATTNSSGVATLTDVSLSGINAGPHPGAVVANFAGDTGYKASLGSNALTVNAKQLTGTFTADDKTYDGGTSATVASKSLPGVLAGDAVSLDVTNAQFDNKNVGTGKTVTANLALSGADAGNYSLSSVTGTDSANITAKSVTGSFTAADKVYDGTNSGTASNRTLNGTLAGDSVSLSGGTATFADGNVGPNKTVTLTGATLAGADVGNYSLTSVGTTTAAITAKELTGSFTAENKAYDGTTDATIATSNLVGVVQGDDVGLSGDGASFADKDVANGKTVTVNSGALSGTDASNYSLKAGPWTATADITPKSITGSFTAANKVYDGTAAATISGRALQGAIGGDAVGLSGGSATFGSKDVGTAKTVTGTGFGLSGTDAANYTLGSVSNTTASITAKSVTGSFTAADKVYDGNDSATVTGRTLPGAIAGDDVKLDGGTAKFSNKNVASAKPVTLTGASLVGADKGNYTLGSVSNAEADITARGLTVGATGIDKVYDGTASATVNLSTNELSGDAVRASYAGASFANKNVGTGKPVSVNGISISGADAANYNLTNATASTAADITARGLVVTAKAANKVYDGTTDATVSLSDNRVSGDVLSTSYASASFDNANAGTGKVVTVSGIMVAGADSGNYTFNTSTTTSADIAKRAITVTADAKSKLFGDADPALTYQVSGGPLVSGDGFSGNLSRDPGEAPGQYSILQGSVSAGPNYAVDYVGAKLTIGAWTTKGFYAPVDMLDSTGKYIVNTVKGGSTVPMKFELFKGATELKDVSAVKSTTYSSSSYCGGAVSDEIEVVMTGSTSLRYDATGDQFIYNWKTPTGAGCYKMTMTAQDGSQLIAYFKTR